MAICKCSSTNFGDTFWYNYILDLLVFFACVIADSNNLIRLSFIIYSRRYYEYRVVNTFIPSFENSRIGIFVKNINSASYICSLSVQLHY